jgi:hypothetical protein
MVYGVPSQACSSDVVVKTHLVDGENDGFATRCKLVVALVGAVVLVARQGKLSAER